MLDTKIKMDKKLCNCFMCQGLRIKGRCSPQSRGEILRGIEEGVRQRRKPDIDELLANHYGRR